MKLGISLPVREMQNDLHAIRDFAQTAEGLGLNHLRVPDQIFRANSGHLHEPMMLLAYIAAVTEKIELVPSVIVLPARQTILFAKQAAELDVLSQGRVRLGIGVGGNREEYLALGEDFHRRGRRCSEQMQLLRRLWAGDVEAFNGQFDRINTGSLDPLPINRDIPMWIGGAGVPSESVARRIGEFADGWFVLCGPNQFDEVKSRIASYATACARDPATMGTEAGVAVVGARQAEWRDRVSDWQSRGLTHLCLRTLGGGIEVGQHVDVMKQAVATLPVSLS